MEYAFTNWTQVPFTGRYGGVDYLFAVGEKRAFDPDKHQMLIIMAKQLADRELLKGIAGVGRNPNDSEKFGKALDKHGNLFDMKVGDRKDYMRRAIGVLIDTPLPVPADQDEVEAGVPAGAAADITELKEHVANLTEMVQSLTAAVGKGSVSPLVSAPPSVEPPGPPLAPPAPATEPPTRPVSAETPPKPEPARPVSPEVPQPAAPVAQGQAEAPVITPGPSMGMTREILMEMAHEAGLNPNPHITKEQLVELLNPVTA